MSFSEIYNNISFSNLTNAVTGLHETLSTHSGVANLVAGSSLLFAGCITAKKFFSHDESFKKTALSFLAAISLDQGIRLMLQGRIYPINLTDGLGTVGGSLATIALVAIPLLISSYIGEGRKTLVCSQLETSKLTISSYSEQSIKGFAPYLYGDLRLANGSKINLNPNDHLVELTFENNSFSLEKGFLPKAIIDGLAPHQPLELMYKNLPIVIIPKSFECTHLQRLNDKVIAKQSLFIKGSATYLLGGLTHANGSKIKLEPDDHLVELKFDGNPFLKIGYLPERLVKGLTSDQPLKLKYNKTAIEITISDKCVRVLEEPEAPQPLEIAVPAKDDFWEFVQGMDFNPEEKKVVADGDIGPEVFRTGAMDIINRVNDVDKRDELIADLFSKCYK